MSAKKRSSPVDPPAAGARLQEFYNALDRISVDGSTPGDEALCAAFEDPEFGVFLDAVMESFQTKGATGIRRVIFMAGIQIGILIGEHRSPALPAQPDKPKEGVL